MKPYRRNVKFSVKLYTLEFEEIKKKSKLRGFTSISEFIRYAVLKHDILIERKILQTNMIVNKIFEIINKNYTLNL